MKVINKKYLYKFLTVLWIGVIFSFSLQTGEVSTAVSTNVGQVIVENSSSEVTEALKDMSGVELNNLHMLLRKWGHFTEFFVLGGLMYLTLRETAMIHKIPISLGLCVLVAVIDEAIQMFMDGRTSQLSDVMLDGCGSLVGICIVWCFIQYKRIICQIWKKK